MSSSKGFSPPWVQGGLGRVRSALSEVDTTRTEVPEPRPLSPKEAERLLQAELLQAVQGVVQSTTALTSRIGRQGAVNGVLDVFLVTLDASGLYQVDYNVTVGSLAIVSHAAAGAMIVQSGLPQGTTPPTIGRGVQRVAAGGKLTMPVGDRALAVWGTAGDQFSLQVYAGLQALGVSTL